jgi:GT2 family glycosyltransferase
VSRLGIVVIGRNEGERLERCLRSLAGSERTIVYVDSGSTDGSVAFARGKGCRVVELDPSLPFSAARARNEGLHRLLEEDPATELVQFVDGDCEVRPAWIPEAQRTLQESPGTAVVCGRRRERHPEASVYNRLCDLEWDTPLGEALACGGDFLARVRALNQAGGFDPSVVAGEEPELCLRLRRAGWTIRRIDAEMTLHDAAITRFGQWWTRMVRSGHGYAQGAAMHRGFYLRENASIVFWSLLWPLAALALAAPTRGVSLLMLAAYLLQIARIARRESHRTSRASDAWLYAAFCVLGKWAQHGGQWKYLVARWRGRLPRIIEYKG